jgi:hypothetical protein
MHTYPRKNVYVVPSDDISLAAIPSLGPCRDTFVQNNHVDT